MSSFLVNSRIVHKMQKAVAAISLILILIFQFSGAYLLFHIQRGQIREQIKAGIKQGVPDSQLQILKFEMGSAAFQSLHFYEKKEFRFKGEMYDIVKKEIHGASIYLYCINDHQETTLLASLDSLVKKNWNESPASEQHQNTLLALSSFYNRPEIFQIHTLLHPTALISNPYSFKVKTWIKHQDTPPPRFIA